MKETLWQDFRPDFYLFQFRNSVSLPYEKNSFIQYILARRSRSCLICSQRRLKPPSSGTWWHMFKDQGISANSVMERMARHTEEGKKKLAKNTENIMSFVCKRMCLCPRKSTEKEQAECGAPGWLGRLSVRLLILAQVISQGSWVRAPQWALRWQHRACLGFCLPLPLSQK